MGNVGWGTEGWHRWHSAGSSLGMGHVAAVCTTVPPVVCLLVFDRASLSSPGWGHPGFI